MFLTLVLARSAIRTRRQFVGQLLLQAATQFR